jgi:hypothetical protein
MPKQDKLKEALEIFGKEYIEELGRELKAAGKDASGNLLRSLGSKVLKTGFGTSYTLEILSEFYLKFVDEGRRAGSTPPPVKPIKEWTKLKGLDEGLAYPIAKSIGEEGIKPTNVIKKSLDKVQTNISFRRLEDGVGDWVDDLIGDRLKGLSKNKNITFR